MPSVAVVVFWACFALVAYGCAGYPLLLAMVAHFRPRRTVRDGAAPSSVSIVIAAHDEGPRIAGRVDELVALLLASGLRGEVIVISDGSTDDTAVAARGIESDFVHVIESSQKLGKAAALSLGCAAARCELLVFADARQRWAGDALTRLVENFADPRVGAASGELIVESAEGVMAGVGLYWRYEKWLRRMESDVGSIVGVTGSICAVRRGLFRPVPQGIVLDDVYWPLLVAMQGFRVVHDGRAKAFDRLPARIRDEFHRKVRTLAGNFQLVKAIPGSLLPWRNPVWLQFVSHKLVRLAVPWALLAMLLTSWLLRDRTPFFAFFVAQAFGYGLSVAGIWLAPKARWLSAAASFLVLNLAAWVAFWVWVSGRTARAWKKVPYTFPATAAREE